MYYLTGLPVLSGDIHWQYFSQPAWENEEGVRIGFHLSSFSNQYQRRQAIKAIEKVVTDNKIPWITPGQKEWVFDLDKLREEVEQFKDFVWLKGKVGVEPEFETTEKEVFGKPSYEANVAFYIVPKELTPMHAHQNEPPIEIRESLERFRKDYPDPTKVAFIMMQFGGTKAHEAIVKGIRSALEPCGIIGLRADDKQYHDDLFPNVLTYLWGCGFGVAIFERIESEVFNPNVSLEVGYMFALRKPVCLIKDRTLKTLHTDLVGKLYREFDPQDPISSIDPELRQWLEDKGIA